MKAQITEGKCSGCAACLGLCVTDAITLKDGVARIIGPFCKGCGLCVDWCAEEAIYMIP